MLKSVLGDSVIYGLASLLSRGLAIFLVPLYTRVLSPSDYGVYDLLVTALALANLVVALEVSQGLARYFVDPAEAACRTVYSSTALIFTAAMYLGFGGVAIAFADDLAAPMTGSTIHVDAVRLGAVLIVVNGLHYLVLNQFRWELRSREFAAVAIGHAALTLGLTLLFCWVQGWGLHGVLLAQIVATAVALYVSLLRLRSSFRWVFDGRMLGKMLAFSLPLVPSGAAVFISLYVNRLALIRYAGMDDIGIFGLATRVASLITLLILGVQTALTPLVYQHADAPDTPRQVARLFSWVIALSLIGCMGLGLFAEEILLLAATADYAAAAPLVMVLAPAMLMSQLYVFAPGIGIRKKTLHQLGVTVLAALVGIAGNWILVPSFGVMGAAVATLLSSGVFLACWFWVSQRMYAIPFEWPNIALGLAAFVLCAWVGSQWKTDDHSGMIMVVFKAGTLAVLAAALLAARLVSTTELWAAFRLLQRRPVRHGSGDAIRDGQQ